MSAAQDLARLEGANDMLRGQVAELTRLLCAARQSRSRLVPLIRWGSRAGKTLPDARLVGLLRRSIATSVIGPLLRKEIGAAISEKETT